MGAAVRRDVAIWPGMAGEKELFGAEPRQFAQERARRTFEGLVSAAQETFAEHGFDATQTPEIATRAGVSVGTFYRYFTDQREVFLEVLRRYLADGIEKVLAGLTPERFAGGGARGAIKACLQVLVDYADDDPRIQRVIAEMTLRDEQVALLRRTFEEEALRQVTDLLTLACSRELVPDPAATAFVIHTAAVEISAILAGARASAPIDRDRALAAFTLLLVQGMFAEGETVAPAPK